MNKETFNKLIKEIGTIDSDVERREKLSEISEEVSKVFDNNEILNTTLNSLNEKLESKTMELEKVQSANMNLWLKLGEQKEMEKVQENSTGIPKEPEKTYKGFDELAAEFIKK